MELLAQEHEEKVRWDQAGHEHSPALEVQHLKHRVDPKAGIVCNETQPRHIESRGHNDGDVQDAATRVHMVDKDDLEQRGNEGERVHEMVQPPGEPGIQGHGEDELPVHGIQPPEDERDEHSQRNHQG